MIDKLLSELITEIKKIRNDMDAVKAYTKTIAEQMEIIAVNTTPVVLDDSEPVETPSGNDSEPAGT